MLRGMHGGLRHNSGGKGLTVSAALEPVAAVGWHSHFAHTCICPDVCRTTALA